MHALPDVKNNMLTPSSHVPIEPVRRTQELRNVDQVDVEFVGNPVTPLYLHVAAQMDFPDGAQLEGGSDISYPPVANSVRNICSRVAGSAAEIAAWRSAYRELRQTRWILAQRWSGRNPLR